MCVRFARVEPETPFPRPPSTGCSRLACKGKVSITTQEVAKNKEAFSFFFLSGSKKEIQVNEILCQKSSKSSTLGAVGNRNVSSHFLEILRIHSSFRLNSWEPFLGLLGHWGWLPDLQSPNLAIVISVIPGPNPFLFEYTRWLMIFWLKPTNTGKYHKFEMAKKWLKSSPFENLKIRKQTTKNHPQYQFQFLLCNLFTWGLLAWKRERLLLS